MQDPSVHLVTPVAHAPFGTSFDDLLHKLDYASLGFWAQKFATYCLSATPLGPVDLGDTVSRWWAGDWTEVARSADALRNLATFTGAAAVGTWSDTMTVLDTWDGKAATAAETYFLELTRELRVVQDSMRDIADCYDTIAYGVYREAEAAGASMDMLVDVAIAGGIALLVDFILSKTPVAPGVAAASVVVVLDAGAFIALVLNIIGNFSTAAAVIESVAGRLARSGTVLDRFRHLELPAQPYDHKLV